MARSRHVRPRTEWTTDRKLSRRGFVLGAGAAALTGTSLGRTSAVHAAADVEEPDLLVGILDRVDGSAAVHVQTTDGIVAVNLSTNAVFCRDDGYELDRFVSGDEVVVEGRWNGAVFVGSFLTVMFHTVAGRVVQRVGSQLATTGGIVTITRHTLFVEGNWRPLKEGDLIVGDAIDVLARKDAATGNLVAGAIFTERS
jgi:hypothetical protein